MSIIETLRNKASKNPKKIVLPESDDPRTIEALNYILDKKIAKILLIAKDDARGKIKSRNVGEVKTISNVDNNLKWKLTRLRQDAQELLKLLE